MLKTSLLPLQIAISQRLGSDKSLNELIKDVLDDVKEGQEYPYVTIGEPDMTPFETKTSFGEEIAAVVHCWSQDNGKDEAYKILDLILQALTKAPLVIEGFSMVKTKLTGMTVITDIDNITKHGIMRLRFHINN